jgi:hypothetical protein
MQFVAKDEDNDVLSLTLRSECPSDKVKIVWLLAGLKVAAGMDENAPNEGSTGAGAKCL